MKYLIVGLGNIGAEYADTRHNIGFDVLDALAGASNAVFTTARYGDVAEARWKGRTLVLLKPSTYMNLSGKAVRYWMDATKVPLEHLLVVSDDIALPFGTLRLRPKGSAGGHNGLKNIAELLGTEEYARMRFGVGGDFPRGHQVDYVLGRWTDEERAAMPERLKLFGDAIRSYCNTGAEDDPELDRVELSLPMFRAYTRGYLSQRARQLVQAEIDHLAFSARYITYEQVLRFLMDYIDGDTYYKTTSPDHNLVRTRAQYKLLQSMERQYDAMCAVVRELAEEYK